MVWIGLRAGSTCKWMPDIHSFNETETDFINMWKYRY